jgi:uncharacterized protein YndB with AHSA1/START domain
MLTVQTTIVASLEKVWELFTKGEHISNWYFAADTWHCPSAENDVKVCGKFNYLMAAKDGSFRFNFEGTYTEVTLYKSMSYVLADARTVNLTFEEKNNQITITESFDPESENTLELQKSGWQMILNNFKNYVEEINKL